MKDIIEKANSVELPERYNPHMDVYYPLIERARNGYQSSNEAFILCSYVGVLFAIHDAYKYGFKRGCNYEKNRRKNKKNKTLA